MPPQLLVPALLAALSLLADPAPTAARAEEAVEQAGRDATANPDDWIRPEDIVGRADSMAQRLEAAHPSPPTRGLVETIEHRISQLDRDLDDAISQAEAAVSGHTSLMAIQEARRGLEASSQSFPSWKDHLEQEAKRISDVLGETEISRNRWSITLGRPETALAGESVVARVRSSIALLDATQKDLRAWRDRLLSTRDRVLDRSAAVTGALKKLEGATLAESASLVIPDYPPLWKRHLFAQLANELPQVPGRLAVYQKSTREYFALDARPFFLQILLGMLLMLALRRLPEHAPRRLAGSHVTAETVRLLQAPFAIAILLTLMLSPILHPTAPQRVIQVLAVLALLPVARVLILANRRGNFSLYAGLVVLMVLDRGTTAVAGLPAFALSLFLGELLIGLILAFEYRRRLLASGAAPSVIRLLSVGIAGLLGAFFAEIGGWSSLATVVGRGILVSATAALFIYAATLSLEALLAYALASPSLRTSRFVDRNQVMVQRWASVGIKLAGFVYWLKLVVTSLGLSSAASDAIDWLLSAGISVGSLSISIGGVLAFVLTLAVAMLMSRLVHEFLEDELFPRTNLPRGIPHALMTLSTYAIWSLGFLLALAAAGVQLGQLAILLGGFGVGIGLGLQDVVKNFAAGITLLLERRVHVGDAVQIPDKNVFGRVLSIGMRASVVRNWNGTEVVMPNDDLVSGTVTNWTLSDSIHRIEVEVGVAYGTDPTTVIKLLLDVAAADERLLAQPPPSSFFMAFGDSSLDFVVRAWSDEEYETASELKSRLGVAVHAALRDAGIEIPFPQREVNLTNVSPEASAALRPQHAG